MKEESWSQTLHTFQKEREWFFHLQEGIPNPPCSRQETIWTEVTYK